LGQLYRISCKKCGAATGASEGHGMGYVQTFENLFLNYMDENDRLSFARHVPSGSRNRIQKCSFSKTPLRCTKCLFITSKLVWSVKFEDGWAFSPPLRCEHCRGELTRFPLPAEGDFKCQCWECDGDTLNIELSAMWD
jgi:hypothetical protein